jgi:hypothetical protein
MNYFILIEAFIIGIITLIFGKIIFNLTINKNNKNNAYPFGLEISFFATGFFLYIINELIFSQHM